MSKTVDSAIEAVKESQFIFNDNHTIEVRNAVLIWTNFRGEANKFGNTARTFNLVINEEMARKLRDDGWNVRKFQNEDMDEAMFFVNIRVNMDSAYPPIVTLYSEFRGKKSRRSLDAESIKELDAIRFTRVDCIINAYTSSRFPDKVSGYLKKLNVIQEPDIEFGGAYDDWMDDDDNQFPEAVEEEVPF